MYTNEELNVKVNVYICIYSLLSTWIQQTLQFTFVALELSHSLISTGKNAAFANFVQQ